MKHKKILFSLISSLFITLALTSCNSSSNSFDEARYEGQTLVTYVLNGGTYSNSKVDVKFYYNLPEGTTCKVINIDDVKMDKKVEPADNCDVDETYKADTESSYITYWYKDEALTQPFDFKQDVLTAGTNLTLYAKWEPKIKHTYNVGYMKDGEFKSLYIYENVSKGLPFSDYLYKVEPAAKKAGITFLEKYYSDPELTNEVIPSDKDSFAHPGGDVSTEVKIYIDYIDGEYKLVKTYSDLNKYAFNNIYLMNDIDCEGKTLTFGNYQKSFMGNGHTISNFVVGFDEKLNGTNNYNNKYYDETDTTKKTLGISLFGQCNNAEIKDVTFDNVTYRINVSNSFFTYIGVNPLAFELKKTKVNNVTINGKYEFVKLPNGFVNENYFASDELYVVKDEQSSLENVNCNIVK